jgi:hypothetical protein
LYTYRGSTSKEIIPYVDIQTRFSFMTILFSHFILPRLSTIPQAPTGFFDPLGLSSNIDQETFDQYRTAELKHGRVAQLAV